MKKIMLRKRYKRIKEEDYCKLNNAVMRAVVDLDMASDCMRRCIEKVEKEVKNGNITASQARIFTQSMEFEVIAMNETYHLLDEARLKVFVF